MTDRTHLKHRDITPLSGPCRPLWCELQSFAVQLIKMGELEKSGIRDGDGRWHNDRIGTLLSEMKRTIIRIEEERGQ